MWQSGVGESSSSFNNNNSFNNNTHTFNNNTDSFNNTINNTINNTTSINHAPNVNNYGIVDERDKVLAWLSPLEPRIRHQDIRARRVEHVGDWLLQTEEYLDWFDGVGGGEPGGSALFCYGDPGVGKTHISSLVVDSLCDWARGRDAAVACFYFDFAAQKEQSLTDVLGSVLKQVVGGLENIPAKIIQDFRDQEKVIGRRKLGLGEIVGMLQDISPSRPTFICIDALDECVAEYRGKLLDSLARVLHKSPNTRIFLAGRLHIRDEVEKHLAGRVVAVSVIPTKDDIIQFLRARLGEDMTPSAMDKSLEEDIIKIILETVSEIFLLVSLNIKAILQEKTLYRRREKLGTMKNGLGLGGSYDATIERIKGQEGDGARLGMDALMWISHSERPLNVDEICHALAVQIGFTDINTNNVPSIWTVLSCCQGLAAVDEGCSTIRLIHFTLKEYLSRHSDLFDKPHSKIAETCLTYLNFQAIKDISASPSRDRRGTPLLEYSSLYWGTHMRMELSAPSRSLALNLLGRYDNHVSAELLWVSVNKGQSADYIQSLKPFSALHCISYFGIAEVAIDLIRMKRWDVNQRDSMGLTPLMWAARHGREEVVKFLLRWKHTQPDIRDAKYGQTALSWAARHGHEGVVRLFLGSLFVDLGRIGRRRGTPQIMSRLFGRKYVNPDGPDNYGRTPLALGACYGHDKVVEVLSGRKDVNPDRPDNYGRTPLSWAAAGEHDGVVKLLLRREDINLDRPDNYGRTPLSLAAWHGHDGVVGVLLGREDVRPDRPGNGGRTLLSWAAQGGHDGVVKLLLGREDVNPDRPDNSGRTPLSWAVDRERDEVVKLLLAREDVSPDKADNGGRTPLSWAASDGHGGAVKLLLGREDVNSDRPDNGGRTPLSWAVDRGRDEVVKLLLGREDVNPDRPDNGGRTPLSWAANGGHNRVVWLLLGREDVNPNRPDNDGRTPLLLAAWAGHSGVVKLLLGREDVSPDRLDNGGRTPLSWAAEDGHDEVVKLLLGREDVNPDRPDNDGRTPLSWAARGGHDRVVELLLERGDVNPDKPDNDGRTPLSQAAQGRERFLWAAEARNNRVLKLLLEREDVNPDRPDNDGKTPLSWATKDRKSRVVKLLKARKAVTTSAIPSLEPLS